MIIVLNLRKWRSLNLSKRKTVEDLWMMRNLVIAQEDVEGALRIRIKLTVSKKL
jgi:hypothetical protein